MTEQTSSNTRVTMLQAQIGGASQTLLAMIAEIPNDVLHSQPSGTANSIAATIGHVLTVVDGVVNGMIRQTRPVYATMPTGLSTLPPSGAELFNWYDWGTHVTVDLPAAQAYGTAVFEGVSVYLATLSDADLDADVPTPMGPQPLADILMFIVLTNINYHTGEIAALKGLHGLQGYAR